MTWRDDARPIISRVLSENPGLDEKALRKLLRDAYPFNQKLHWPYKVWCDEVNVHLGKKHLATVGEPRPIQSLPGQMLMF